jgi:hypothetical protein
MRWSQFSHRPRFGFVARALSFLILALPTVALALLAVRTGSLQVMVGTGVQALFLLVFVRAHPVWRPPVSVYVVVVYLVALGWAWIPLRDSPDWAVHVTQGLLLLSAVGLFAVHDLTRTGAEPLRRALKWSRAIAARKRWPAQLADCRLIPEAIALRDAVRDEAGPALALLSDPRPQVQAAALGALEHRARWRPGEAELVLKVGQNSPEPAVRAAAAYALAGVTAAELVTALSAFLRDPAPEVRRAAAEALMWDAEARWPFAREGVKEALADPRLENEGPLFAGTGRLPGAAVADLATWSAEHPPLAHRAILTLTEHYNTELVAADRPDLGTELARMMLDNDTPPALRVELASLLRQHHLLTADLLDRLTNLDQPAPMRLFAAELMLRINPHDPDGIDVLRGLARQPNRELAILIATVLQGVLGVEVGLPDGELPQANSKTGADVARRVLAWANGTSTDVLRSGLGMGASRPPMSGLGTRAPAPAGAPADALDDSLLAPPLGGSSRGETIDDSFAAPPPIDESVPVDESVPIDESVPPPEAPPVRPPDGLPGARRRSGGSSAVF